MAVVATASWDARFAETIAVVCGMLARGDSR